MDAQVPIQQGPINEKFYQGDPWLVLVKDRLHVDNTWNTAIFFIISITFNISFTTIFIKDIHPAASLFDALHLLLFSCAFTSGYLIYLVLPTFMADTFDTLRANGVIGNPRHNSSHSMSYESFMEKLAIRANSRWWISIIVVICTLFGFQMVFLHQTQIPLFWNFFRFLVGDVPLIYITCFVLIRIALLLVFINQLFLLFTIHIKPLHSDGSGGLGSLGYIGWISAAMMLATSLALLAAIQRFSSPVDIIIVTASYLVLLLGLVVSWLLLPHHVMLQARKELLQPLTDEYEQAIKEAMPSIKGDTPAIVAGTERLAALQKRYEQVRDSFPTWPIEIVQMRRLAIALLLPLLFSLLPSLLGVFIKK